MLSINFYKVSCRDNRMDKSPFLKGGLLLWATLKYPTSITDPVLDVKTDLDSVANYNYVYIGEFKRWYFVRDTTVINNELTRVTLHVDVLMTYKDAIKSSTVRLLRTNDSSKIAEYLADNAILQTVVEQASSQMWKYSVPHINNYLGDGEAFLHQNFRCFVLTIINIDGYYTTPTSGKNLSDEMPIILPATELRGNNSFTASYAVTCSELAGIAAGAKNDAEAFGSYILSVMAFPFDFDELEKSNLVLLEEKDVTIGEYKVPYKLKFISQNIGLFTDMTKIKISKQYNDFRDYKPFTKFSMFLPYYGDYDIEPRILYDGVTVQYIVNYISGEMKYVLVSTNAPYYVIDTIDCNIGCEIPVSESTRASADRRKDALAGQGWAKGLTSVISIIAGSLLCATGVGTTMGAGLIVGGIAGTLSNPLSQVPAQNAIVSSAGGAAAYGSLAAYFKSEIRIHKIELKTSTNVDDMNALQGRSSDYIGKLSELAHQSYVLCERIILDEESEVLKQSLQTEREEITTSVLSGIWL